AVSLLSKVRFFRPGVYDLNRFRFVVDFNGGGQQQLLRKGDRQQGRVTFVFPAQYLVTVAPLGCPIPR
ncbi:unnamed protein product, partial [Choristocarpus tenellus]